MDAIKHSHGVYLEIDNRGYMVSKEQEQQEKQEQQVEEQPESSQPAQWLEQTQEIASDDVLEPPRKKGKRRRIVKKERQYTVEELEAASPRPSFWPMALAFSVVLFLLGAIGSSPIFLGAGIVLIVVCVIGWGLERR